MPKKDILTIKNLAEFESLINRDSKPYDINMMVMPGTLEDKHKNVDPEKGIQALRRQFNLVYLLLDGLHDVHLGAEYRWLKPNDLVIVPENMVYASSHIRACKGYCIHFKTEFLQPLLRGPLAAEFPFFSPDAEHIVNLPEDESIMLQHAFNDIIAEYERFSYERDSVLRNYIHILLLRIREIYRPRMIKMKREATRATQLAHAFKQLVEKHFITMRKVQEYADQLHITTKYLYEVTLETFGRTPRDMITEMLLLESKVQLISTEKSISEIAFELNFSDQAHFTHFIKQRLGCTPLAYRERFVTDREEIRFLTGRPPSC